MTGTVGHRKAGRSWTCLEGTTTSSHQGCLSVTGPSSSLECSSSGSPEAPKSIETASPKASSGHRPCLVAVCSQAQSLVEVRLSQLCGCINSQQHWVCRAACLAVVLRSRLGVPGLQDGHAALVLAAHEVSLQVHRTGGCHVADGAVVLRALGGTPGHLVTTPGLQAALHSRPGEVVGQARHIPRDCCCCCCQHLDIWCDNGGLLLCLHTRE